MDRTKYIVAERSEDHPKGPKVIARWLYGMPVPAGVIIGKNTYIRVETLSTGQEVSDELIS